MKEDVYFINIFPMNDRQQLIDYSSVIRTVVDYSLDLGFKYTLMTVGDKRMDPWVLSQYCLQTNTLFSPLIAVNPFYQHPVQVVKKIITLKILYSATISINLVTGSFFSELKAVNDNLDFKNRSLRLKEFYLSMSTLVDQNKTGFKGQFYQSESAEIFPKYNYDTLDFFMSGSIEGDLDPNKNQKFVQSIRPIDEMVNANGSNCGLSLGICARENADEALSEVNRIYPENRKGEMLFSLSINNSLTPWNIWLKSYIEINKTDDRFFYLKPMKNFWSSAPFLVGSYDEVAKKLKEYSQLGYKFFVLDFSPEEAGHIKKCLESFKNQ